MDVVIATCLNPQDRFRVVCFEWQGERYCCLRQLCSLMGLDYEKAKRITLARIPIQLSPAVMLDGPDKLVTCGVLFQDMPKWLELPWKRANANAWERLEDMFEGGEVQAARARRRKEVRVRRRVHITHEMVSALYRSRAQGLSYKLAGEPLGMVAGTAFQICKGNYRERLSKAAQALWDETFAQGDPHPNPRILIPKVAPTAPVTADSDVNRHPVDWTQIYRIHQTTSGGGTVEEAAKVAQLPVDVVNSVISGEYWPKGEAKPPIWNDLFG